MLSPRIEKILLFLSILFLPTQLGKHFWLEFSFIYSLPIDYLSPTFYFWDILVACLCTVFILRGSHISKLALNLFFLFILSQTLSLLSPSANIGAGLTRLEQYLISGLFGVYLASSKNVWIKPIIFWALALSILGETILATAQFLHGGTLGFWIFGERSFSLSTPGISKFDFYGREFLRPYATFPHPNALAGFMILGIVILTLEKELWQVPRSRMVILGTTILAGLVTLLTVSRVAIIAGFVSATVILAKSKWRVLLLIIIIILLPILYTRFSSLANFDNLTFIRREELSLISLRIWQTSPFLGVGLNNFIPADQDLLLSGPSRFLQPVHNIFLLALSETGIVGLIGLITLIGYPIMSSLRKQGSIFYRFRIKSGMTIIWMVIIFLGMFDHYFLTLPQGYRLLFFIWGLTIRVLE